MPLDAPPPARARSCPPSAEAVQLSSGHRPVLEKMDDLSLIDAQPPSSPFDLPSTPPLFEKKTNRAKIPTLHSLGAAGYDLHILHETSIPPQRIVVIETGIKLNISPGTMLHAEILPRSGIAPNFHILVIPGVIDRDYRGDLKIAAYNFGTQTQTFAAGARVAQLVFRHTYYPPITSENPPFNFWGERNNGGFGSTGLTTILPHPENCTHKNCCPESFSSPDSPPSK